MGIGSGKVLSELRCENGRGERMKTWHKKAKKDLRELCREKYGDEFVNQYDSVNKGIPIGNLEETLKFLAMVEAAKMDEVEDETD